MASQTTINAKTINCETINFKDSTDLYLVKAVKFTFDE